jgi:thymidylate kinase
MNQNIVKKIFKSFNSASVKYFLLRDYSDFFKGIDTKDIDLYIAKKDYKKAKEIFLKNGFKMVKDVGFNYFAHKLVDDKLITFNFKTKLLFGKPLKFKRFSRKILREIENNVIKKNNIFILKPKDEFLLLLLHSVFDKKEFLDKHKKRFQELVKVVKLDDKSYKAISNKRYSQAFKLCKEEYKSRNFILPLLNYLKFSFIHRFKRKGMLVSIVGCDGTGKTTIAQKINNELNLKTSYVYMGARKDHDILPTKKLGASIKIGKKSKLRDCISSYLFLFEYFLRYLTRIYPVKSKKKRIVLVDRSLYDIFVNKPYLRDKKLFNFLINSRFFKPDLIIYLTADEKTIFKRKKQYNHEELQERLVKYDKIYKKLGVKINVSGTIDETYKKVVEKIWERYITYSKTL